jgi:hypothetical protein
MKVCEEDGKSLFKMLASLLNKNTKRNQKIKKFHFEHVELHVVTYNNAKNHNFYSHNKIISIMAKLNGFSLDVFVTTFGIITCYQMCY